MSSELVLTEVNAGVLEITVPLPAKEKTKVKVQVGKEKQLKS